MTTNDTYVIRAELLSFDADPGEGDTPAEGSVRHIEDAALWIEGGRIRAIDDYARLEPDLPPRIEVIDHRGKLLMPGFIDSHVHYVQLEIMASYGRQLLDWLNDYTFPEECRFAQYDYALALSNVFLDEMLRVGTTTAQVFCSSHPDSVDAFFTASSKRDLRMLAGKVLMNRHAPETLCDDIQGGIRDTERLISDWHGTRRLGYSLTPRFAPTSTRAQLDATGGLLRNDPSLWLQTHLSENTGELDWVAELFPESRDYLEVYEQSGLVGPRSTFAHGIHLDQGMRRRLADRGANLAFCPSSNLFLGSGLFDRHAARDVGLNVTYASDIGGGTDLSGLATLKAAYQVGQLRGQPLTAWQGLYGLTLGNARALSLDSEIGRLAPGMEADFVVLDLDATPLLSRRHARCRTLSERLFALMMMGDDRSVLETWASGRRQHVRD
ncbi:guanine deaminase [Halomonas sp. QX-2]|jgi:guanine deaminase|uniref:Guanine deaminase n=1 Tax=Vreelandella sedimenti TaxID=2729618 RepID=A0A7Z0NBJ1_9GAMM|nr:MULTISPECIES: guanine deaminase [Halomonas]NYT75160.1 guanine deaminase [Halomonas sedimenti]|tara:strand:- start:14420 stop:15736 length:1317 start_codon:yes stop_codon:yes gene_type:complete